MSLSFPHDKTLWFAMVQAMCVCVCVCACVRMCAHVYARVCVPFNAHLHTPINSFMKHKRWCESKVTMNEVMMVKLKIAKYFTLP